MPHVVLTVGHSTRTIDELIELLQAQDVARLVDVRTIPRSSQNPQFNRDALPKALAPIAYTHAPELGGLRRARKDSPNTGWRNLSFRGFADYMLTAEFEQADRNGRSRSHRHPVRRSGSLAMPSLPDRRCSGARGIPVEDVIGSRTQPHKVTPFATVEGTRITYPAPVA